MIIRQVEAMLIHAVRLDEDNTQFLRVGERAFSLRCRNQNNVNIS